MSIRFDRSRFLQTGAVAALLLFCAIFPAHAQNSDVASRMTRLENEIDTLSRAVFKGEIPPAGVSARSDTGNADIQNRMTQLQMEVQALTGKVEEQNYEINRLKLMDARITALEGRPQSAAVSGTAPSVGMATAAPTGNTSYTYSNTAPKESAEMDENFSLEGDPNAPVVNAPNTSTTAGQLGTINTTVDSGGNVVGVPPTPAGDYEAAFTKLRNQDYAGAQTGFDAFIKANPGNSLIPNAMYWLGETYYVQNQFPEATRVFAEAYQKYPKGAKAPDNLLKLGMALAGQGKTKDACVAWGQLKKEYPAGAAPVLTRADQEIARLKCNAQ